MGNPKVQAARQQAQDTIVEQASAAGSVVADKAKETAAAATEKVRRTDDSAAPRRSADQPPHDHSLSGQRQDVDVESRLPHPFTGQPFASPVPPGTGWPEDPAEPDTPVATTAAGVRRLAAARRPARARCARSRCAAACPRLVRWREDVAATKRASFADQPYWGRPDRRLGLRRRRGRDRRARARGQRRQPHRPGLHRRQLGGLAVREPAPGRPRHAAHVRARRRRAALIDARMVATVRLRAAGQQADAPSSATPARPGSTARCAGRADHAGRRRPRRPTAGTRALRALAARGARRTPAEAAVRPRAPRSSSRTGSRRAARLLPPQPAEHLHRPAHARHARRRASAARPRCAGRIAYAVAAPVSQPAEEVALKATQCGFEPHRGHRAVTLGS